MNWTRNFNWGSEKSNYRKSIEGDEMSECVWWRQFGCRDDDDDDGDVYIETSSNGSNSNRNRNSNSTELIWWWWNWHTFGTYTVLHNREDEVRWICCTRDDECNGCNIGFDTFFSLLFDKRRRRRRKEMNRYCWMTIFVWLKHKFIVGWNFVSVWPLWHPPRILCHLKIYVHI